MKESTLDEKRQTDLILNLLSNIYNSSCDCRKQYGMPVNMDYKAHSEDCPFRIKCEYSGIEGLLNGE